MTVPHLCRERIPKDRGSSNLTTEDKKVEKGRGEGPENTSPPLKE